MFDIANNHEFLTAIGIDNASEDVKTRLIAGIEDLAKKRLVIKLSDVMTDAQAEEFGNITDEKQAYDYLMKTVPNFSDIVASVFAEIKAEILQHKATVVG